MKYKIVKLSKENDLNRELRRQKKERSELTLLFVSPWDKYSSALVERLEKRYANASSDDTPLYVVDSYNMPHSFVIFNSSRLPQFVNIRKYKVFKEDYLPFVYRAVGLD